MGGDVLLFLMLTLAWGQAEVRKERSLLEVWSGQGRGQTRGSAVDTGSKSQPVFFKLEYKCFTMLSQFLAVQQRESVTCIHISLPS